jgi:UDP-N-acetyl-D-glucosamine dehydrogenase
MKDPTPAHILESTIKDKSALVGIVGLGYVGLPLALAFVKNGFRVLGFDTDPAKIDQLERGSCYIKHLDGPAIATAVASGDLQVTSDFARLAEPEAILICVPTPLGPHREPNLSYVEGSAHAIRETLRTGQLVVLESTTYPGTTDTLVRSILEQPTDRRAGGEDPVALECGRDFFLAFSPEREDPGNQSFGTTNTPKLVGGVDEISGDLAQALYDQVVDSTVRVSSASVAEAAKLTENIFRSINIALVNELKVIYDRIGIDIWEVLDAADTKPFGFMRFNPGPGLGGHCIPLDPFYLAWRAREAGMPTRFIELAGEINRAMPGYVVDKLQDALNERKQSVKGSKILILGLAYKPNIDDPRESPAFEIIDRLLELGADVSYHDPHIPAAPPMRSWPQLPPMESVALSPSSLARVDAAVLVTDHAAVDYKLVLELVPLIIDTRGALRDQGDKVRQA